MAMHVDTDAGTTPHRWPLRLLSTGTTLLLLLCVGGLAPRVLLSDGVGDQQGADADIARLARTQLRGYLGPLQSLVTTEVRVVNVEHDPSGCEWSPPAPAGATGSVRLQTYTLFGLPFEQWTVTCSASWSSWEPLQSTLP